MENGTTAQQAPAAARKPKLTRLKIESFRNVAPCDLRFADGFNVLLGLNATGKTTLLELIAAALSFDFSKIRNEAFAIEYDLSCWTWTISVSIRNERVTRAVPEPPHIHTRDAETFGLTATVRVRSTAPARTWTVCADLASVWLEDNPLSKQPLWIRLGEPGAPLWLWAAELGEDASLVTAYNKELWHWETARRFDEGLDMFRDVIGSGTGIDVRFEASGGTVRGMSRTGVVPAELLQVVGIHGMAVPDGNQGLTIPADSISFLRTVVDHFGFKSARLEMRLESKAASMASLSLKFGDFRFMFEDHDGSVTRHEDLSYGQKRLLAFYYYLAASPLTVIADELVDGLHHGWISAAIEAIGDRQAFLASQNPLLLDHLEFDSAEHVASTFITCRTERNGDGKRMAWSNLSDPDAERFFRAYQVDVKHVSEILLSKGLW